MTANPELADSLEPGSPSELPSFNLENVTDPITQAQLVDDEAWLLENPERRLLALYLFARRPEHLRADSQSRWPHLADPDIGLIFDDATEDDLYADSQYQALYQNLLGNKPELSYEDEAAMRIERLRFFLRKAARVQERTRNLGKITIDGAA